MLLHCLIIRTRETTQEPSPQTRRIALAVADALSSNSALFVLECGVQGKNAARMSSVGYEVEPAVDLRPLRCGQAAAVLPDNR
jgi:hypothetical protein